MVIVSRSSIQSQQRGVKATHKYNVFLEKPRRSSLCGRQFHFIGIGGVGMSALAQLLARNGAAVTGSDQVSSATIATLEHAGVDVHIGHDPQYVQEAGLDAVVVSAAIKEDNPELGLARQRGHRVVKYAQMLGELMNQYQGIAVSGTHGKSTTSAWLSFLMRRAQVDVNFIVGALVGQLNSSSGIGESDFFVAEACEYDRSFLNIRPVLACILNVEQDHLDYYRDEAEIVAAFKTFASGIAPQGFLVVNGQDKNCREVIEEVRPDVTCVSFGLDESCSFHARHVRLVDGLYRFDVYRQEQLLGTTGISLPGKHNVLNALAVTAMACSVGIPSQVVLDLLPEFTGISRRLTLKGEFNQITILDDYAHHPTEVKATLEAIRERYRPDRLWCVFQPHQYSRTRFLLDDFAESFKLADVTLVPEIYFVRDSQEMKKAINAQVFVERLQENGSQALFLEGFTAICDHLEAQVRAGDLVVTMGAGDVWKVADEYIQRIRGSS
jgi:UDP-N-acetylmuramate--alanine ligase